MYIKGTIMLESIDCANCGSKKSFGNLQDKHVCDDCGALYTLISSEIEESNIKAEYKFAGFSCMEIGWLEKCDNVCPTPYTYCEKHSSDFAIKKVEGEIETAEKKVNETKEKLKRIKESKKIWIISELSGIKDE
jgi:hypothetical protein